LKNDCAQIATCRSSPSSERATLHSNGKRCTAPSPKLPLVYVLDRREVDSWLGLTYFAVVSNVQIMEKRIPQNPRYRNTQSKIDSGSTVNKVRLICKLAQRFVLEKASQSYPELVLLLQLTRSS
jgi:hypothetical protein